MATLPYPLALAFVVTSLVAVAMILQGTKHRMLAVRRRRCEVCGRIVPTARRHWCRRD